MISRGKTSKGGQAAKGEVKRGIKRESISKKSGENIDRERIPDAFPFLQEGQCT